jgi:hypothetical protein
VSLVAFLLVAVAKYCTPQQPQIANWFEEYYRMWGVSFEELTNVAFRASWFPVAAQFSSRVQLGSMEQTLLDSPIELGNSKRRMSLSDTSSTGLAMTSRSRRALGVPVSVTDPSPSFLGTGSAFALESKEDATRNITGILGQMNARSTETGMTFIGERKWILDGTSSRERLGTLSVSTTTGAVANTLSSTPLHPKRSFIGDSLPGVELSALPANGYTGRPIVDFGKH